ncbi:hypothetical protein [Marinomonas sp. 2405UD68-3]|uniref:hypothetical protein n=1 Tax=Marinomonas sp. 2405UD68-3 TaxID=3391835 RepID=UPI0039C9A6A2
MDIKGFITENSSKIPITTNNQKPPEIVKSLRSDNSISSFSQKLAKAETSINDSKLKNLPPSELRDILNTIKETPYSNTLDDSPLLKLPKPQLESVIFDISDSFSSSEKRLALDTWYSIEDDWVKSLFNSHLSLANNSDLSPTISNDFQSRQQSISPFEKALLPEDYENLLNERFNSLNTIPEPSSSKGYDLMIEEFYGGVIKPPVSGVNGMGRDKVLLPLTEFLTTKDRELFGEMFAYAEKENIDFKHLRSLATDLGRYRQHNDGKLSGGFNTGHFDLEGHQLTVSFIPEDEAIVERVSNSDALDSTKLDKKFLNHLLDPSFGALMHSTDFEFLEHMIHIFSDEGSTSESSEGRFANYTTSSKEGNKGIIHTSEEVVFTLPEPVFKVVNGVGIITPKGIAEGFKPNNSMELDNNLFPYLMNTQFNSLNSLLLLLDDHKKNKEPSSIELLYE